MEIMSACELVERRFANLFTRIQSDAVTLAFAVTASDVLMGLYAYKGFQENCRVLFAAEH
jgi:hypothetical protein